MRTSLSRLTILVLAPLTLIGADGAPAGYLGKGAIDPLAIYPPAPVRGDARYAADRALFKATRRLAGTPRWALATSDVSAAMPDMLRNFSCAAGIALTPEAAPRLAALMARVERDANDLSNIAKARYQRQRPFLIDRGPVCQPLGELKSFDYPSGAATVGWAWGAVLAQLLPDRATALLARGRAYGESRMVCGAHNASAVEAGRLSGATTVAAIQSVPAFQADMDAARVELAALRQTTAPPSGDTCTAEAELVAQKVY